MDESLFQCVRCGGGPVHSDGPEYRCGGCGATYPVRSGVPLFLRDVEGELTDLPIDLPPGRALSVPVWVAAPARTGRYTLEVALCRRGEWLGDGLSVPVRVVADWGGAAPRHWRYLDKPQETYSYLED